MTQQSLVSFDFNSRNITIVVISGEPWFIASEIAEALGYRDSHNAARHLADHQRGTHIASTPGGDQRVTIINESGLYRLVLRSRKPEAEQFCDWVTGEVLPSIRKTGSYSTTPAQPQRSFAELSKLAGKYSQWAYDARQAMQRAGVAAPEWPAELNHDDLAAVVLGDLLRSYRWVLNFDEIMGVSLTPVPLDAVVLTHAQQEQWRKQQMSRVLAAIESGLKEVAP